MMLWGCSSDALYSDWVHPLSKVRWLYWPLVHKWQNKVIWVLADKENNPSAFTPYGVTTVRHKCVFWKVRIHVSIKSWLTCINVNDSMLYRICLVPGQLNWTFTHLRDYIISPSVIIFLDRLMFFITLHWNGAYRWRQEDCEKMRPSTHMSTSDSTSFFPKSLPLLFCSPSIFQALLGCIKLNPMLFCCLCSQALASPGRTKVHLHPCLHWTFAKVSAVQMIKQMQMFYLCFVAKGSTWDCLMQRQTNCCLGTKAWWKKKRK